MKYITQSAPPITGVHFTLCSNEWTTNIITKEWHKTQININKPLHSYENEYRTLIDTLNVV